MSLPPFVTPLIDALLAGVRQALGDNLLGFYMRGSLALGGFNAETSDVDILVVTERPVSDPEFQSLAELHARIPARDNEYKRHYEAVYIDRASIRRLGPSERRHPTVGSDWEFQRAELRPNWVFERWTVREHGIAILGPDPKTLIDSISPDELRQAARDELRIRTEDWAKQGRGPPGWLTTRYYQAFEIETLCRALYTVARGELPTKEQAVVWALATLPEPWRTLVEWSREHHADKTRDTSAFPDIVRFVLWAVSQTEAGR